jgi:hypothetical protein
LASSRRAPSRSTGAGSVAAEPPVAVTCRTTQSPSRTCRAARHSIRHETTFG